MVDCGRCGYHNEDGSKFCANCGGPFTAPPPYAAPGGFPQGPPQAPQAPPQAWDPSGWAGQPGWGPGAANPPPGAGGYAGPPSPGYPDQPQGGGAGGGYGPPGAAGAPYGEVPPAPVNPHSATALSQPPGGYGQPRSGESPPAGGWSPAGLMQPYGDLPFDSTARPPTRDELAAGQGAVPGANVAPPAPFPAEPAAPAPLPEASPAPAGLVANAARGGLDPESVPEGAPRVLVGFLVSFDNSDMGAFWPLHQGRNDLGRIESTTGLHIEIDHPTTSSRHATLLAASSPGRLKLEDLGSTNGTFVNEVRLEPGARRELKDGDTLRFGGFAAVVKIV